MENQEFDSRQKDDWILSFLEKHPMLSFFGTIALVSVMFCVIWSIPR